VEGESSADQRGRIVSQRRCFALDLVDDADLIAEYEARHAPGAVWPAVVDHLRAIGMEAMEIWRAADRLVMIAQTSDDYPRDIEAPPEIERWEQWMWRFQRPLPDAAPGQKWVEMHRVFSLSGE
jgi:L-rhamnose mutarotase